MIVIATGIIPLSPLPVVSAMVMWESSQWLTKNNYFICVENIFGKKKKMMVAFFHNVFKRFLPQGPSKSIMCSKCFKLDCVI